MIVLLLANVNSKMQGFKAVVVYAKPLAATPDTAPAGPKPHLVRSYYRAIIDVANGIC